MNKAKKTYIEIICVMLLNTMLLVGLGAGYGVTIWTVLGGTVATLLSIIFSYKIVTWNFPAATRMSVESQEISDAFDEDMMD